MSRQAINRGSSAGDNTGETLYVAFGKVNANFAELYARASVSRYVAGNWYWSIPGSMAAGAVTPTSIVCLQPFLVSDTITISDIGARVTTPATSGKCQFGIYISDPVTYLPTGAALCSTSDITTTASTKDATLASNVQLTPGLYWAGTMVDATAGSTVIFKTLPVAQAWASFLNGSPTQGDIDASSSSNNEILTAVATYGTWPDLTSATFTRISAAQGATLQFKVASVP